jgi:small multidrug resistance pump
MIATSDSRDPRTSRRGVFRLVLAVAALYHVAFAAAVCVWPEELWRFLGQTNPPPRLWLALGAAMIGSLGALYALAALRFELARPVVAVGLLCKVLPPLAWLALVTTGRLRFQTVTLIVFDDLVWYFPFLLILTDGSGSRPGLSVPTRLE